MSGTRLPDGRLLTDASRIGWVRRPDLDTPTVDVWETAYGAYYVGAPKSTEPAVTVLYSYPPVVASPTPTVQTSGGETVPDPRVVRPAGPTVPNPPVVQPGDATISTGAVGLPGSTVLNPSVVHAPAIPPAGPTGPNPGA